MIKRKSDDLFRILEFNKILEKVSEEAFSVPGKEKLERLHFFTDPSALERELALVSEMRDCLKYDDAFPLEAFSDFRPELEKTEVTGAFLCAESFLSIKEFLVLIKQIKNFFIHRPDKYPLLQTLAKQLTPLPELEKQISWVVGSSAEILDRASHDLYRIRNDIRKKETDVRKRLDIILREMSRNGFTQENTLVLRDGKLVIPMKDTSQGRLKGIVVDQSASGATVFMEPYEIVEIHNDIRKLKVHEKFEEEKILKALTVETGKNRLPLLENLETAADIDLISARARFSLKIEGQAGCISQDGKLELKGAKHPFLFLKLGKEMVVPLDIKIGDRLKTVVITGPNAGGKTVALKTVGLLAVMHQHGLHIPAADGSCLPLFSNIYADIGDRQSIEQDLSTFSSHIQMIKTILGNVDKQSLILLDEIGSATDPEEGSALAQSILDHLTRKGCLTLVTTHLGALKMYAHDTPGVINASLAFNQKTLQPGYRFQMGIPGSSYAFEIAQRFGLPESIVLEARLLAGAERGKLDNLVADLERESRRVHDLLVDAEIEESRLAGLISLYHEKIAKVHEEVEKSKQNILDEAEVILRDANRQVENILRELRESQGRPEIVRKLRSDLTGQMNHIRLHKKIVSEKRRYDFHLGDWLVWQGHGGRAKVISETDPKGKLWIQWENLKLQVPVGECIPVDGASENKSAPSFAAYTLDRKIKDEVDLRGMTVEESITTLERYLSDALAAGFSQIRIIHGKGTGVLRREINKHLTKHVLVKSMRFGNWNEGDTGVTVVEFK